MGAKAKSFENFCARMLWKNDKLKLPLDRAIGISQEVFTFELFGKNFVELCSTRAFICATKINNSTKKGIAIFFGNFFFYM